MLVCWWWQFGWSFAHLIAPVVTTSSSCFNKVQKGDILIPANPGPPGKWPFGMEIEFSVFDIFSENFRCLCTHEKGFGYKGSSFHRIIPQFVSFTRQMVWESWVFVVKTQVAWNGFYFRVLTSRGSLWWTCGCAGKTVKSLENTCHTRALLRWWFTTTRRYIKCTYLYFYYQVIHFGGQIRSFQHVVYFIYIIHY